MASRSGAAPQTGVTRALAVRSDVPMDRPDGSAPFPIPTRAHLSDGVVVLRAPRPSDEAAIVAAANDPDVARFTMVPVPYGVSDAHEFVGRAAENWATGQFIFAIADAATDELLGMCGLHDRETGGLAGGAAEIGYWLAPAARGAGVMTRALTLVCQWAFDAMPLERISWWALVGNTSSRAVAERVGFQFEGTVRRGKLQRGQRVDAWIAGLLREDLTS